MREGNAPHFEIIQDADQVPQRAAQPVELPDNEGVPYRECLETAGQFRSLDMRPRGFLDLKIYPHLTCFKAASGKSGFWSSVETAHSRFSWACFVPDFWHHQVVDWSGAGNCVKTLDFWHSKANWTDRFDLSGQSQRPGSHPPTAEKPRAERGLELCVTTPIP